MAIEVLQHSLTRGKDPDSPDMVETHRRLIDSKPLLREIHQNWYHRLKASVDDVEGSGLIVELGCGASQLETVLPAVIKTDIAKTGNCAQVVNAEQLPYHDNSVKALLLVGVLHHLPDPERFFKEAQRVLIDRGRLVMIEPSDSVLHAFMTNMCNPHEFYDPNAKSWKNYESGRMSNANNAIPSIIFRRDAKIFEAKFPKLVIRKLENHTFLAYYVTGGMSYPSFLPAIASPLVRFIEWLTQPLHRWLGTMMTIDLEKHELCS